MNTDVTLMRKILCKLFPIADGKIKFNELYFLDEEFINFIKMLHVANYHPNKE